MMHGQKNIKFSIQLFVLHVSTPKSFSVLVWYFGYRKYCSL